MFIMNGSTDLTVLKELVNYRFDALEARLSAMVSMLEKENGRQDEAIERLADRTTPISETTRLENRTEKLEGQIERGQSHLNDLSYKVKVIWMVGTFIGALLLALLIAIIKGWIGV